MILLLIFFNQHVITMIRDKDQEYFIEYWSEVWGSKTSAWPMANEHKKITIKLYQNHNFQPRVEIFGVGSIKQCNFAQRPRHGKCIDIEVKRPLMGHILRKIS